MKVNAKMYAKNETFQLLFIWNNIKNTMHSGILVSHLKEWNNAICSNVDGPRDCHTEWSKSYREGEMSYDIPFMWNLKQNGINELTK